MFACKHFIFLILLRNHWVNLNQPLCKALQRLIGYSYTIIQIISPVTDNTYSDRCLHNCNIFEGDLYNAFFFVEHMYTFTVQTINDAKEPINISENSTSMLCKTKAGGKYTFNFTELYRILID